MVHRSWRQTVNTFSPTNGEPIVFDVTRLNPDEHYNITGIYTVPLDGIYEFTSHIWGYNDPDIYPYLNVDGTRVKLSNVPKEIYK